MLKFLAFLFACAAFVADISAQQLMLILDRAPTAESVQSFGMAKRTDAFIADDFVIGAAKEDWIIDRIRLWAVADPEAPWPRALGDLVKKISLLGGIAPDLPQPNQPKGADCDCHNLPVLKSTSLQPGSNTAGNRDVEIASGPQIHGSPTWQIDFNDLRWSVPSGVRIQFGVFAEPNSGRVWYNLATPADPAGQLRVFSSTGKFEKAFTSPSSARINVQVWGHLLARISIRPTGQKLQVILWNAPFLGAEQVDRASLHFGPGNAVPESTEVEDVQHSGQPALVMLFQPAASGITPRSVNACLTGKRQDGAPFEACDLLSH
ncbi:MAG: hypothetical protein WBQ43_08355 [Terriglobales bacterium]